jgi:hypothetical protein
LSTRDLALTGRRSLAAVANRNQGRVMTDLTASRQALQRVATHVLARARHQVTGRFGLRVTAGGIGTPAFGPDGEVLRISGTTLVREVGASARYLPLAGASLASAAGFADLDLARPFSAGQDTPPMGDPEAPVVLDGDAASVLHQWWAFGWQVLDAACVPADDPGVVQLWPEHFDAGTSVRIGPGSGDRCNLGVSPGDAFSEEPYLYLGPWGDARPGDPAYWNAPFGAVLRRSTVCESDDPAGMGRDFLRTGLTSLATGTTT